VVVALSFLALAISGAVLWVSPPGRIANWTDWAMLGLRKSEWIDLHIWFALLFVAIARLEANGLKASAAQTLREIAVNNGYQRPGELMRVIRGN
jgi:hypothetical protein